jgi:hypothetical protein
MAIRLFFICNLKNAVFIGFIFLDTPPWILSGCQGIIEKPCQGEVDTLF